MSGLHPWSIRIRFPLAPLRLRLAWRRCDSSTAEHHWARSEPVCKRTRPGLSFPAGSQAAAHGIGPEGNDLDCGTRVTGMTHAIKHPPNFYSAVSANRVFDRGDFALPPRDSDKEYMYWGSCKLAEQRGGIRTDAASVEQEHVKDSRNCGRTQGINRRFGMSRGPSGSSTHQREARFCGCSIQHSTIFDLVGVSI
eukprot:scaffold2473_cov247-Pinguiococcus_pyrenoidosus.AAC.11